LLQFLSQLPKRSLTSYLNQFRGRHWGSSSLQYLDGMMRYKRVVILIIR
jgi:hypothetical protein